MSYAKPFHNTLNYASTANIEEVMKLYNLGHKTFEADFSSLYRQVRYIKGSLCKVLTVILFLLVPYREILSPQFLCTKFPSSVRISELWA